MVTVNAADAALTIEVFTADRACARTVYAPPVDQLCGADVTPAASHPEFVPSPQVNMY
jgi:hypothetical protein